MGSRSASLRPVSRVSPSLSRSALACRSQFLRFFPDGFRDETYVDWERGYKKEAAGRWTSELGPRKFLALLERRQYREIAETAVRIESRTNLLFSFEKMALRDAIRSAAGARVFAEGLYRFLHERRGDPQSRFEQWCDDVASLPRRQTRVLTWPVLTVFGFLARPDVHVFLKPNVTRVAARRYGFDFEYTSRPAWRTYASLLELARIVRSDPGDLAPRDMIDIQSFLWVQGSDEYE